MEWYFSSRTIHRESIKKIGEILKKHGHEVSFEWTDFDKLESFDKTYELSEKIRNGIINSEIFVMISDKEGTDMYVELGIAIQNYKKMGNPKIYSIGRYNKRSLMLNHESIKHFKTIEKFFHDEHFAVFCSEKIIFQNFKKQN